MGFLGGHGTAAGMAQIFNDLNWPAGGDVASTTATMGLMSGIFGGMILINIGARKGYTKYLTEKADIGTEKETYQENRPIGASLATMG